MNLEKEHALAAGQPHGPLTLERSRLLVRRILQFDEDEVAAALIELLEGVGYEPDRVRADNLTVNIIEDAFTHTLAFGDAVRAFQARCHKLVLFEPPNEIEVESAAPARKGKVRARREK